MELLKLYNIRPRDLFHCTKCNLPYEYVGVEEQNWKGKLRILVRTECPNRCPNQWCIDAYYVPDNCEQ